MTRTPTEAPEDTGEVIIGTDVVRIRRPKERGQTIAAILHREGRGKRVVWLVLDRLVHDENKHGSIGGWSVSGAITTELRA